MAASAWGSGAARRRDVHAVNNVNCWEKQANLHGSIWGRKTQLEMDGVEGKQGARGGHAREGEEPCRLVLVCACCCRMWGGNHAGGLGGSWEKETWLCAGGREQWGYVG